MQQWNSSRLANWIHKMHSGSARAVNFVLKKQESDIQKAKETLSQNLSRSSTNMLSKKLIFQSERSSNAQGISFYICRTAAAFEWGVDFVGCFLKVFVNEWANSTTHINGARHTTTREALRGEAPLRELLQIWYRAFFWHSFWPRSTDTTNESNRRKECHQTSPIEKSPLQFALLIPNHSLGTRLYS